MSFSDIWNKITHWGSDDTAATTPTTEAAPATDVAGTPADTSMYADKVTPPATTTAMSEVDVAKILDAKNSDGLNWRSSITDFLKLLEIDSSLTYRQSLADELGYTGDKNDTATMNVWLHQAVMEKLEASGGATTADLT